MVTRLLPSVWDTGDSQEGGARSDGGDAAWGVLSHMGDDHASLQLSFKSLDLRQEGKLILGWEELNTSLTCSSPHLQTAESKIQVRTVSCSRTQNLPECVLLSLHLF